MANENKKLVLQVVLGVILCLLNLNVYNIASCLKSSNACVFKKHNGSTLLEMETCREASTLWIDSVRSAGWTDVERKVLLDDILLTHFLTPVNATLRTPASMLVNGRSLSPVESAFLTMSLVR